MRRLTRFDLTDSRWTKLTQVSFTSKVYRHVHVQCYRQTATVETTGLSYTVKWNASQRMPFDYLAMQAKIDRWQNSLSRIPCHVPTICLPVHCYTLIYEWQQQVITLPELLRVSFECIYLIKILHKYCFFFLVLDLFVLFGAAATWLLFSRFHVFKSTTTEKTCI